MTRHLRRTVVGSLSVACLAAGLLGNAGSALARDKDGVRMPDTVQTSGKTLVLNGMGTRVKFNFDVYVAGLYLETKSNDGAAVAASEQVKRLDLVFVRDVERKQIVDAWKESFGKNRNAAALKERAETIYGWMSDMKERESLTFVYIPGTGLNIYVRGKKMGTIEGADFQSAFFSIWLGPSPPNEGLKKGLLGS